MSYSAAALENGSTCKCNCLWVSRKMLFCISFFYLAFILQLGYADKSNCDMSDYRGVPMCSHKRMCIQLGAAPIGSLAT